MRKAESQPLLWPCICLSVAQYKFLFSSFQTFPSFFLKTLCQSVTFSQLQTHTGTLSILLLGLGLCKPYFSFASGSHVWLCQKEGKDGDWKAKGSKGATLASFPSFPLAAHLSLSSPLCSNSFWQMPQLNPDHNFSKPHRTSLTIAHPHALAPVWDLPPPDT